MRKPGFAALFGLLLTLPLAVMEFLFNGTGQTRGYVALFGFLWILATLLSLMCMSLVQSVRAGTRVRAKRFQLVLRVGVLAVVVMIWGSVVVDQFPCFLGVPNCD
jgi:hypothetical protein